MIPTLVRLYLVSAKRIALLEKIVHFTCLPRVREHVKFRNRSEGDYFAFTVVQVTHREQGCPEIVVNFTTRREGKLKVSLSEEVELDRLVESYRLEDWMHRSCVANRTIRPDGSSDWDEVLNIE